MMAYYRKPEYDKKSGKIGAWENRNLEEKGKGDQGWFWEEGAEVGAELEAELEEEAEVEQDWGEAKGDGKEGGWIGNTVTYIWQNCPICS